MVNRALRVIVLDQGKSLWGAERVLLRLLPLMREHGVELILAGRSEVALAQEWHRQGGETFRLGLPMDR